MKKLFCASLLLIFLISACGTGTTAAPTSTEASAAASATGVPPTSSAAPAVPTSTPTTSAPVDSSECTDASAFVADVTIPDYSHFEARENFTKTWRVKNIGTCSWTSGYIAAFSSGDRLNAPLSVPLSETAPGATLDVSVNLAAPAADGTYKIFYQLKNPSGQPMAIDDGESLWAIITVGKVLVYPSPTPQTASTTTNTSAGSTGASSGAASCVSQGNSDFLAQTLILINSARAANGLPALTPSAQLNAAAQSHSQDMACTGLLSHTGSDGSVPAGRIAAAGYSASITRENIYAQPPQYGGTAQAAMDWWMNDQTHREAILDPQVTEVGVGYAYYSNSPLGGYFTVVSAAP